MTVQACHGILSFIINALDHTAAAYSPPQVVLSLIIVHVIDYGATFSWLSIFASFVLTFSHADEAYSFPTMPTISLATSRAHVVGLQWQICQGRSKGELTGLQRLGFFGRPNCMRDMSTLGKREELQSSEFPGAVSV